MRTYKELIRSERDLKEYLLSLKEGWIDAQNICRSEELDDIGISKLLLLAYVDEKKLLRYELVVYDYLLSGFTDLNSKLIVGSPVCFIRLGISSDMDKFKLDYYSKYNNVRKI